ncbi:hypothetical protein AB0E01_13275 [Nocardia vinacea]|uniref:hypothetical protein n=1 Tax=Nocardia vinacea TaxID=96468 RepID=UPI0033F771F4
MASAGMEQRSGMLAAILRMTRTQILWAGVGIGVLIAVTVLARGNLNKIYEVQPDFVLGATLTISTFCFTKAFSRNGVDIAVQLIQEGTAPEVVEALNRAREETLHRDGVYEQIALLIRNLTAANNRAVEYYDLQAKSPRFYLVAPYLSVVMQDLDEALHNAAQIGRAVGSQQMQLPSYPFPEQARYLLREALRDLHEAVARRNEAYEALSTQFEVPQEDELWGAFTVMTSDSLKALRDLESLLGKNILAPPKDQVASLRGYVEAAQRRAKSVDEMINGRPALAYPPALAILLQDLEHVLAKLEGVDTALARDNGA